MSDPARVNGSTVLQPYLDDVARAVDETLGRRVEAIVLTGSAALGDFDRDRSDVDLILVVSAALDESETARLVSKISHDTLSCPAVELDLVVYQHAALDPLRVPVQYELGFETGIRWGDRVHPRGAEAELVLDLALAREHGVALRGLSLTKLISPVPRAWILDAALAILPWHESAIHDSFHDPRGCQAVLNACRALYYCECGGFVSKRSAAKWAASKGWSIATRALSARIAPSCSLPHAPVAAFVRFAMCEVEAARRRA